jgi:tetratricopeptide (TPR) repeat protein
VAVGNRHREWCQALAEQAVPALGGSEVGRWLERLEAEHDNLRAALEWCLADADGVEAGLRLAGTLWWFWHMRGYTSEGRAWLERTLARGGTTAAWAVACCRAGHLAWHLGDFERATARLKESLALGRALGDRRVMAYALGILGNLVADQGDEPAARAYLAEGVAVARAAGDRVILATALYHYGGIYGELASERAALEESLALWRAIGDRVHIAAVLSHLGRVAMLEGELTVARAHLEESLALQRALGMTTFMMRSLYRLGWVARLQGAYAEARALYAASLTAIRDSGDRSILANVLVGLAGLAAAEGQAARAARLFGAVEAVRAAIGSVVLPAFRAGYDRGMAAARAALDEEAFAAAWAAGQAMTPEEAIADALAEDEGGDDNAIARLSDRSASS